MDGQSDHKLVRLERSQEEIRDEIAAQGGMLRTLLERADEIVRLLTPAPSDGPTLEELLAQHGEPRIFISHGTRDGVLPIDRCSRPLRHRLERAGYEVRYREFDGEH